MPWRWSPHGAHPLPFGTAVCVDMISISGTILSHCRQGDRLTYRIMVDPHLRDRVGDHSVENVPASAVREWMGMREEERG